MARKLTAIPNGHPPNAKLPPPPNRLVQDLPGKKRNCVKFFEYWRKVAGIWRSLVRIQPAQPESKTHTAEVGHWSDRCPDGESEKGRNEREIQTSDPRPGDRAAYFVE